MNQPNNTAIVQQAYAAFGRGDIPALLALVDEQVDWHPVIGAGPEVPTAGRRQGRAAVGQFFATLGQNIHFTVFEPKEFVAQGDKVVALGRYAAKVPATGRTFESDWAMVFTFRAGKILAMQEFTDSVAVTRAFSA